MASNLWFDGQAEEKDKFGVSWQIVSERLERLLQDEVQSANVMRAMLQMDMIADKGPTEITQEDTFFNCPNGRLNGTVSGYPFEQVRPT